jgi:hypothetical protein
VSPFVASRKRTLSVSARRLCAEPEVFDGSKDIACEPRAYSTPQRKNVALPDTILNSRGGITYGVPEPKKILARRLMPSREDRLIRIAL